MFLNMTHSTESLLPLRITLAMKTCGVVEVWLHSSLATAIDRGERCDSRSVFFNPTKWAPVSIK
jgi:hypothetical protein